MLLRIMFACFCTGESSFEVKFEADNDFSEHPHDDASQDRICLGCVTNGLERKHI